MNKEASDFANGSHYRDNAGQCALSASLLLAQVEAGTKIRPAGIECIDCAIRDLMKARDMINDKA